MLLITADVIIFILGSTFPPNSSIIYGALRINFTLGNKHHLAEEYLTIVSEIQSQMCRRN